MTKYEKGSFAEREKDLGDLSEGVFEEWAEKRGVIFVRMGFSRPPFKRFYMFHENIRLIPDYACEGANGSVLIEVKGCGKEGLKIKEQSIAAMLFWNELNPVHVFVYNSSSRKWALIALDTLIALCKGKTLQSFNDGKVYYTIPVDEITWEKL